MSQSMVPSLPSTEELSELLSLAEIDPGAAKLLRELEEDMSELQQTRTLAKAGEVPMLSPKHIEALESMIGVDQLAVFAGNQSGKTATFAQYVSWVATGLYPDEVDMCVKTIPFGQRLEWFDENSHSFRVSLEPSETPRWVKHITVRRKIRLRKFMMPTLCWISSHSGAKLRETLQQLLFGGSPIDDQMGTGLIPKDRIVSWKKAHMSVPDLLDNVQIRSEFGGLSTIQTKMASQGAEGYTGSQVHVSVLDEKHPYEVLTEAIARTTNTGGVVLVGYTPRDGSTKLTEHFKNPQHASSRKRYVTMSTADASYYSDQRIEELRMMHPKHEQRARFYGMESLGAGLVFPFVREEISCEPVLLRSFWYYGKGGDFGHGGSSGHPTAGCWCAWDKDSDIIYVYREYKSMDMQTSQHASVMKRPDDIWMFWPHDGLQTDKSGTTLAASYEEEGVRMWHESARYVDGDGQGGGQGDAEFIQEVVERVKTGRLKVFSHLTEFFKEQETWHYLDNGKTARLGDDLIKAFKSAMIMRRHWQQREDTAAESDSYQYQISDVI